MSGAASFQALGKHRRLAASV